MDTAQRDDARFMHTWSRLQHEARRRFAGCSDCSVAMTGDDANVCRGQGVHRVKHGARRSAVGLRVLLPLRSAIAGVELPRGDEAALLIEAFA